MDQHGRRFWRFSVIFALGLPLAASSTQAEPPGRVSQYMGLAQIPWLLAKGTTGLYSGYLLATLCPANTPANQMHTGELWLIYALIAMTSPIGLWLARGWVQRGLHQSRPTAGQIQTATE